MSVPRNTVAVLAGFAVNLILTNTVARPLLHWWWGVVPESWIFRHETLVGHGSAAAVVLLVAAITGATVGRVASGRAVTLAILTGLLGSVAALLFGPDAGLGPWLRIAIFGVQVGVMALTSAAVFAWRQPNEALQLTGEPG